MTIRCKQVDKAFKLLRDGIEDANDHIKNPQVHPEIKQVYRLKLRILIDIRESFDEYATVYDLIHSDTPYKEIFSDYLKGEIKLYESGIGEISERLILNTLYQFRIELMKRLIEKYQKFV